MNLNRPENLPVLSQPEVTSIVAKVNALRSEWRAYDQAYTIYRLGATSNAALPREEYMAEVRHTKPLLQQHFGDLLERVRQTLEPVLQEITPAPVVLDHQFGVPGFHLFFCDDHNSDPLRFHGGFHCDMLPLLFDWDPPLATRLPLKHCVSFTLALELPAGGGGLLVCENITSNDVLAHSEKANLDPMAATSELVKKTSPTFHPYEVGKMAVHSGQVVHAPAPWDRKPGDRRITLQGQGFFNTDRWRLFW